MECQAKWNTISTQAGNVAFLDRANIRDTSFIGHIFTIPLEVSPTLPMPEMLRQDPALTEAWFDRRVQELGRLPKVKRACLASGDYNFATGSVFTLTWAADGSLEKVTHISGAEVAVPKHLAVTKEWKLVRRYNDTGACLELPTVSHSLVKLFSSQEGPNLLKMTSAQFRQKVLDFDRRRKEDLLAESRKHKMEEMVQRAKGTLSKSKRQRQALAEIALT